MKCKRAVVTCAVAGLLIPGAVWAAKEKSKEGDPAKGKVVFDQCVICHDANSTAKKLGPGLKGLFKRDKLASGKKVTEQNVRTQINEGGNGMPSFKDMLSDEEKNDVIAFLKTL